MGGGSAKGGAVEVVADVEGAARGGAHVAGDLGLLEAKADAGELDVA